MNSKSATSLALFALVGIGIGAAVLSHTDKPKVSGPPNPENDELSDDDVRAILANDETHIHRTSVPAAPPETPTLKDMSDDDLERMILNARHVMNEAHNVDSKELARGAKFETDHLTDPREAERVALDHLLKEPHYYRRIEKPEQ